MGVFSRKSAHEAAESSQKAAESSLMHQTSAINSMCKIVFDQLFQGSAIGKSPRFWALNSQQLCMEAMKQATKKSSDAT